MSGIVRKMDGLNRLVIPKEICKLNGWGEKSAFDISFENGNLLLKPVQIEDGCTCKVCGTRSNDLLRFTLNDGETVSICSRCQGIIEGK